jgi:cardiolipin synthase
MVDTRGGATEGTDEGAAGAGTVEPETVEPETGEPGADRVLTVPNAFTMVRLVCIPIFVVLVASSGRRHWEAAAYLLAAVGATDWVDGQLARRLHQVSSVGKVLDPLADRLLLVVGALTIIAVGAVPLWIALVFLLREVVVAAGFLYVAARGGRRMDVSFLGKAATFALMCALPLFLLGHAPVSWHEVPEALGLVASVPAVFFGWYSTISYVPVARALVAEVRPA